MTLRFNTTKMRLLEEVTYLSKAPEKGTNLMGEPTMVSPTFPYNTASKTAPATAERWAEYGMSWEDRHAGKKAVTTLVTRANHPFQVSIVDLDVRSEGGRAYKVVDDENRLFDLREDQLLEALRHVGIQPGGKIPGNFVWGLLGSQLRMIFVGGDFHDKMTDQLNEMHAFQKAKADGKIPTEASLEAGHIYRKRDQSLHLFMGRIKHPELPKKLFAFLELPVKPENLIDVSHRHDNTWMRWATSHNNLFNDWDKISWSERVRRTRETSDIFRTHTDYVCDGIIRLMSSPKFEADVGNEPELVALIKGDVRYMYQDHADQQISEKLYFQRNGHHRSWSGPTFSSHRASIEYSNMAQKAYSDDRQAFIDAITWE